MEGLEMKTRSAFVANSSSSSFIVEAKRLTGDQIMMLLDGEDEILLAYGRKLHPDKSDRELEDMYPADGYNIHAVTENGYIVRFAGDTSMNNGDLPEALEALGFPMDCFQWND
jgi:hypothetical protein